MNGFEASHRLIVGLGSPHGDDQAGWLAIDALSQRDAFRGTLRKAADPTELFSWMTIDLDLTLIDACERREQSAGTIRRWEWPNVRLERDSLRTTHGISLSEILETTFRLGTGPSRATIWTIAGRAFEPSTAPSAEVISAAERLAALIATEVVHA